MKDILSLKILLFLSPISPKEYKSLFVIVSFKTLGVYTFSKDAFIASIEACSMPTFFLLFEMQSFFLKNACEALGISFVIMLLILSPGESGSVKIMILCVLANS